MKRFLFLLAPLCLGLASCQHHRSVVYPSDEVTAIPAAYGKETQADKVNRHRSTGYYDRVGGGFFVAR